MKLTACILFLCISLSVNSQINGYAQVTAISSTTFTIGSSNETYGAFATGLPVIVMQMQDNSIGANTSNNSSFGNLSSIQSTGAYEIAHVTGVTRVSGNITQITISSPLATTFSLNSNSSVQIITYPLLGSNYSTTADINALAWNGSLGGVIAFRVTNTLTLNHNIIADNAGFRGGAANSGSAGSCDNTTYITATGDLSANKGEGIYKVTNTGYAAGRAKILNGGGGANSHNGGGGGGSNASAGGLGGQGYGCSSSAGGTGGVTLYSLIGSNRAFMGGGGGGGEGNNSFNTAGGNGGGVIIISANQVVTSGTGPALRIGANGQTAADVGNDGAGGGGAGGSILLSVNSWNIVSTKPISITANGGNGGNVNDAAAHGGGGGGGQGAVIFRTSTPATNITTQTSNGSGGRNNTGGTFAENGVGSNNVGIFNGSFALLPSKIVSFKGARLAGANQLTWHMVNEGGVSRYEVERSYNGTTFERAGTVAPGGSVYEFKDTDASESNVYYRVAIYNGNGQVEYSGVVMIKLKNTSAVSVILAPNPVASVATLKIETGHAAVGTVRIINTLGMLVDIKNIRLAKGDNTVSFDIPHNLQSGNYQLVLNAGSNSASVKMMIRR